MSSIPAGKTRVSITQCRKDDRLSALDEEEKSMIVDNQISNCGVVVTISRLFSGVAEGPGREDNTNSRRSSLLDLICNSGYQNSDQESIPSASIV